MSNYWDGRVSDKHLTSHSKFLDHLQHGDVIFAGRSFNITELVARYGAEVKFQSFKRGKSQLTAEDVDCTRRIANVERVISSVCQTFSILGATCLIDYVITKSEEECQQHSDSVLCLLIEVAMEWLVCPLALLDLTDGWESRSSG